MKEELNKTIYHMTTPCIKTDKPQLVNIFSNVRVMKAVTTSPRIYDKILAFYAEKRGFEVVPMYAIKFEPVHEISNNLTCVDSE